MRGARPAAALLCALGLAVLLSTTEREHVTRRVARLPPRARAAPPSPSLAAAPPPFDLDEKQSLAAAVRAAARGNELVLLTSDLQGARAAANMALQLARLRIRQHLVLMGNGSDCAAAQRMWPWLTCGVSRGIAGFERYQHGTSMTAAGVRLWALWSAKWLLMARLVEMKVNVLALDTDMLVLADPYPILTSAPFANYTLLVPSEGTRVNLGVMYARGAACHPRGGTASVFWDVVRRLRLFVAQDASWLLRDGRGALSLQGVWDQGLFTDALESAGAGAHLYPYTFLQAPSHKAWRRGGVGWPPPSLRREEIWRLHRVSWREGRGAVPRPRPYVPPYAAPAHAAWRRAEAVRWLPLHPLPPLAALRGEAEAAEARAASALEPGWIDAAARPHAAAARGAEAAAVPPAWLYCAPPHRAVSLGWPACGAACALLHLVELRAQFVSFRSLDTLKANRPYVMAAYGAWPVDEPPPATTPSAAAASLSTTTTSSSTSSPSSSTTTTTTSSSSSSSSSSPSSSSLSSSSSSSSSTTTTTTTSSSSSSSSSPSSSSLSSSSSSSSSTTTTTTSSSSSSPSPPPSPPSPPVRAVRLPREAMEAAGAHAGVGGVLNALQLLHAAAAVSRRVPVVPSAPCGSRWIVADALGAAGVRDDYVLPRWEGGAACGAAGGFRCHLSMGGARCDWPRVVPAWRGAAEARDAPPLVAAAEAAAAAEARPCNGSAGGRLLLRLDLAALRAAAAALAEEPLVELQLHFSGTMAAAARACWSGERTRAAANASRPTHGRSLLEAARWNTSRQCTLPFDLVGHNASFSREERGRLKKLHLQCPAFFASPSPTQRDARLSGWALLQHMHRRRPVAEPCDGEPADVRQG